MFDSRTDNRVAATEQVEATLEFLMALTTLRAPAVVMVSRS